MRGREVLLQDGKKRSSRTDFNSFGQAISTSDISPSNATLRTQTYEYGLAGNRTRYTDGRGNVTVTKFNAWDLPESVIEPSTATHPATADRTWTMAYDAVANPVKMTAPGGVVRSRSFDAAQRLTAESGTGAAATVSRSLGYDTLGRLVRASTGTDGSGNNTFAYNDRGQMTGANGPGGSATFGYDGDGNLTSRADAAGSATFSYVKGRLSSDKLTNSAKAVVSSVTYGYDLDDRMTQKTTTGTAGAATNTYAYDQAGRMTSWTRGTTKTEYGWDDSGNRTKAGAKTSTFDERNRLLGDGDYTYNYTARGTLSGRTSSGLTEALSFDAFDRLVTQGSTTYTYDGLDRMATRAGVNMTYAGAGDELVSDGTEVYAHGAFDELLAIAQGTSKRITLDDQHGDLVGGFDAGNTSLTTLDDSVAFDPFGQVLQSSGTKHNLGFQGDYTDPTTGDVDMGARWYSPETGSFMSRDSARYSSGPSILANGYTYGAGAPMDYNDPDGNWPSCSLCNKAKNAVSSAVSSAVGAVKTAATYVYHAVQYVASKAWSAVKAVGRAVASAARSIYNKAKSAVSWVGNKIASAATWAANKAAAAAAWARERAEAARKAAIAAAKAVTAKAKAAAAAAIKNNPLPAIKAALIPVLAGIKTVVSVAADVPAQIVSGTKNAIVDGAKATQAIYAKAVEAAGVVIESVSTAASAAGEFASAAMPTIIGIAAGVATGAACMAVAGPGNPACIVAGFAVGGAVTSALECAPGRSVVGCAARGGAAGAAAGLAAWSTGGLSAGASLGVMVGSGAASGVVGNGVGQVLEGDGVDAKELAVSGALGAAGGGVGHGLGKLLSKGCGGNSFVPGTQVLMADGSTKAIDDVEVGELVLATDPTTGKTSAQPVTDRIVGTGDKHLVELTLDTENGDTHTVETITATDGHPFWVDGNGEQFTAKDDDGGHWADAGDLRTGDRLRATKGGAVAVLDTSARTEFRTVYNLTVEGVHTYLIRVGSTEVVVHNCTTTVYRAQTDHPGSQRLSVDSEGNVSINGDGMLHLNISGNISHSEHFRGSGGQIIAFDVSKAYVSSIKSAAISQRRPSGMSRRQWNQFSSGRPQIDDPGVGPDLYGLPSEMFPELLESIIPGSGRAL